MEFVSCVVIVIMADAVIFFADLKQGWGPRGLSSTAMSVLDNEHLGLEDVEHIPEVK